MKAANSFPGNGAVATKPSAPRLEVRAVSKTFAGTKALDNVDLLVAPSEIHGLIGQNGSGKSTLVKVLSGFHTPDAGAEIRYDGVRIGPPMHARRLTEIGLAFVHQDLGLVPRLSVLENVRVGQLKRRGLSRRVNWRHEEMVAREALASLASNIDPWAPVSDLTIPERGTVAIARALQGRNRSQQCIVFDEATQNLPKSMLPEFYDIMRHLAADGASIVLVSHRLDEIMALADRVTVLRDGRVVEAGVPTRSTSESALMAMMLGYSVDKDTVRRASRVGSGDIAFGVRGLSGEHLRDVSLEVRSGEIVGLTGTVDAGHEEFPYLVTGARRALGGVIRVGGHELPARQIDVSRAMNLGISLVPQDRSKDGLAFALSLLENLTIPRLHHRRGRFWLGRSWQRREFSRAVELLGIVPPKSELAVAQLSGGNQQKVLLAKWILGAPQVLILHEPTQAVDVGARRELLVALARAADQGMGIAFTSIEAEDLASVCDRVLVFDAGRIVTELMSPLDADAILRATFPPAQPTGENDVAARWPEDLPRPPQ